MKRRTTDAGSAGHRQKKVAKRERSSRACIVCRRRKVKCDAMKTYPNRCTNCVLFNIPKCEIPQPKKRQGKRLDKFLRENNLLHGNGKNTTPGSPNPGKDGAGANGGATFHAPGEKFRVPGKKYLAPGTEYASDIPPSLSGLLRGDTQRDYPEISSIQLDSGAIIRQIVRLDPAPEYMGSTGPAPIIKQILNEYLAKRRQEKSVQPVLDDTEYRQMVAFGCFSLPSEDLCRRYIKAYFDILHWQQPVLNRHQFLHDYQDLRHPPSLLLLQSVLFAGSRVYEESWWGQKEKTRQERISYLLHRRAQVLYNMRAEKRPLPLLQALIIFGNYWDSDFISSKNGFFCYLKVAISTAYCMGLHRSHRQSLEFSPGDKRLFRRIWWTLFTKDCFYSFTFGRPWAVDLDRSDVEPLTEGDLEEGETDDAGENGSSAGSGTADGDGSSTASSVGSSSSPKLSRQYFLQRIKLAFITRKVADYMQRIRKHPSAIASRRLLERCDTMLTRWLAELAPCLTYNFASQKNSFYSAFLAIEYYSVVLVLHRSNIVRKSQWTEGQDDSKEGGTNTTNGNACNTAAYPSWSITFKAAHLIACLGQFMLHNNYLPVYHCFVVYSMVTAGTMMICHLYNRDSAVSAMADQDIHVCFQVLNATSLKWPVSKLAAFYLKSIYRDKFRQFTLIKDILKAADPAEFSAPGGVPMLDSSITQNQDQPYLISAPAISAQRYTPNDDNDEAAHSHKVTDASIKTILYNRPAPTQSDIILPSSEELQRHELKTRMSDSGLDKLAEVASVISGESERSEQMQQPTQTSSQFQFPGVEAESFPQAISDNWVPSFDTSSFPTATTKLGGSDSFDDNLFSYLGSTDLGMFM